MYTKPVANDDKTQQELLVEEWEKLSPALQEDIQKLSQAHLGEYKEPIIYANVLKHVQDDFVRECIWKGPILDQRTKWEPHLRRHGKVFLTCDAKKKKFIAGPVTPDTGYNLSSREKSIILDEVYRPNPDINEEERNSVGGRIFAGALLTMLSKNWVRGRALLVESLLDLNLPDTNFYYLTLDINHEELSLYTYNHTPLQIIEGG